MNKDEIIRLPFVVVAYQQIYPSESTCGICNLPWSVCGMKPIKTTEDKGVFYVCPHCWEKNSLTDILKASVNGYLSQINNLSNRDKELFIKEFDLGDILMKIEEEYIKTHHNGTQDNH